MLVLSSRFLQASRLRQRLQTSQACLPLHYCPKCRCQFPHDLLPFTVIQLHNVLSVVVSCCMRAITFDQVDFGVRPAELFHLLDSRVRQ